MERIRIRCAECLGEINDVDKNMKPAQDSRCVDCGCLVDLEAVLVWELAQYVPSELLLIMARASRLRRDLRDEKEGFVWAKVVVNKNGVGTDGGIVDHVD